jgi:hypothetical protein
MTLKRQNQFIDEAYKEQLNMDEPDIVPEKVHDMFEIDMDIDIAIRIIQNNERGRQGIYRINTIKKIMRQQKAEKDMQKMLKRGRNMDTSN